MVFHKLLLKSIEKKWFETLLSLSSSIIRQRLLENRELTLDKAFSRAKTLDLTYQHSQVYSIPTKSQIFTAPQRCQQQTNTEGLNPRLCFFCGKFVDHERKSCPVRSAVCFKYRKLDIF